MQKSYLAAALFVVALLGACFARCAAASPRNLKLAEAFASGALLNAALVHLLADASRDLDSRRIAEESDEEERYPIGALLCGIGCLFTHGAEVVAEALLSARQRGGQTDKHTKIGDSSCDTVQNEVPEAIVGRNQIARSPVSSADLEGSGLVVEPIEDDAQPQDSQGPIRAVLAGPLLMVALSLHSLLEGLSLGAAKQSQVFHIFAAILAHKGVAAFTLGVTWLPSLHGNWQYFLLLSWFAAVTPLGVFIGTSAEGSRAGSVMTALSAGTFLHVALVETLPGVKFQVLAGASGVLQAISCSVGFGMMALLGLYF